MAPTRALELGGRRIFAVHYDDYGYAMACTGDWELVCCGHSHKAEARRIANVKGGETWLVNPGHRGRPRRARDLGAGRSRGDAFEVRELGREHSAPL